MDVLVKRWKCLVKPQEESTLWLLPSIAALSEADGAQRGFPWVSCGIVFCGCGSVVLYLYCTMYMCTCVHVYMYSVATPMASQGPITWLPRINHTLWQRLFRKNMCSISLWAAIFMSASSPTIISISNKDICPQVNTNWYYLNAWSYWQKYIRENKQAGLAIVERLGWAPELVIAKVVWSFLFRKHILY